MIFHREPSRFSRSSIVSFSLRLPIIIVHREWGIVPRIDCQLCRAVWHNCCRAQNRINLEGVIRVLRKWEKKRMESVIKILPPRCLWLPSVILNRSLITISSLSFEYTLFYFLIVIIENCEISKNTKYKLY